MDDYIDLNRQFKPVIDNSEDDFDQIRSYKDSLWAPLLLSWDKILSHPRVLILGTAGSGKTRELQAQCDKLISERKAAFFLRLENLANIQLSEILVGDEELRFQNWITDYNSYAWFFLDSVDELKFRAEAWILLYEISQKQSESIYLELTSS